MKTHLFLKKFVVFKKFFIFALIFIVAIIFAFFSSQGRHLAQAGITETNNSNLAVATDAVGGSFWCFLKGFVGLDCAETAPSLATETPVVPVPKKFAEPPLIVPTLLVPETPVTAPTEPSQDYTTKKILSFESIASSLRNIFAPLSSVTALKERVAILENEDQTFGADTQARTDILALSKRVDALRLSGSSNFSSGVSYRPAGMVGTDGNAVMFGVSAPSGTFTDGVTGSAGTFTGPVTGGSFTTGGTLTASASTLSSLSVSGTGTFASILPQVAGSISSPITTDVLTPSTYNDSQKFLAIGQDGFPRFVYVDLNNTELHFVQCLDQDCVTKTNTLLVTNVNDVDAPSIVMGTDGFARISYMNYNTPNELRYIQCTNASCSAKSDVLVDTGGGYYEKSFALDANNLASIVYNNYTDSKIHFAHCTNADCSAKTIDSTLDFTYGSSFGIAIAPDGFARYAYFDMVPSNQIHFVQCTNVTCSTRVNTAVYSTAMTYYVDMVLGADGFGRVAYWNNGLYFTQCTNIDCSTNVNTVIDPDVEADQTSLVLGNDGFPRISYDLTRGGGTDGEKYIQCTNASCSTKNTATLTIPGGYPSSIALGLDGFPRVLYAGAGGKTIISRLQYDEGVRVLGSSIGSNSLPFGDIFGTIIRGALGVFSDLQAGDFSANQDAEIILATTTTFRAPYIDQAGSQKTYHNLASYTDQDPGFVIFDTKMPLATSRIMFSMKIRGFVYDGTGPFDINIGGYICPISVCGGVGAFVNLGYTNIGAKKVTVRLGRNIATGNVAVILGDSTTSWSHATLMITDFTGGHYVMDDLLMQGWTSSGATSLSGYDTLSTLSDTTVLGGVINSTATGNSYITGGRLGIGTTSPAYLLHVGSASVSGIVSRFQNSTGYCDINPTTTSLTCTSDERLKKNILTVSASSTLDNLLFLNPVMYNWLSEDASSSTHAGFLAQDVQKLFPDLVATDDNGMLSVSYTGFIPYIISGLKGLASELSDLPKTLTHWFADTGNGIAKLFVGEVHTETLCIGQTCVTEKELKALMNQARMPAATLIASTGAMIEPTTTIELTTEIPTSTPPLIVPEPVLIAHEQGGVSEVATTTEAIGPDTSFSDATPPPVI